MFIILKTEILICSLVSVGQWDLSLYNAENKSCTLLKVILQQPTTFAFCPHLKLQL